MLTACVERIKACWVAMGSFYEEPRCDECQCVLPRHLTRCSKKAGTC